MKIIIKENQMRRLFESNTVLDNLNNMIKPKDYSYKFGYRNSVIIPDSVFMEGSIEDEDITVHVAIGEVMYDGKDVTDFANNYVFWSGEGNDSELAYQYKDFIVDKINKILRLTPIQISEWDVVLGIP